MVSRRSMLLTVPLAAAALTASPTRSSANPPAGGTPAGGSAGTPAGSAAALASRVEPDTSAMAPAADAVRGFTADFYRALAVADGSPENLVCSPYSVAVALAMVRAGAQGVTATEMDSVLHAPQPRPRALDAGLNALDQIMVGSYQSGGDGSKIPQLAIANSLWAQYDLPLRAPFLSTLTDYYAAEAHLVDFGKTEDARLQINDWISARTNERIPNLLPERSLSPLAKLVLANAIYLKAAWMFPFRPAATVAAPFTRDDGRVVSAQMMSGPPIDIGYQEGDGWVSAMMPYVGDQLAMAIVVPTTGNLARISAAVNGPWLSALLRGFRGATVDLKLPRWTFRLPADLGSLLSGLGMPTAFTDRADFSGITTAVDLCVDKVVHETFIAVDERGTEAAGATAIIVRPPSIPVIRPVRADRPFLFVIFDYPRGVPLFIGRVYDPTSTAG